MRRRLAVLLTPLLLLAMLPGAVSASPAAAARAEHDRIVAFWTPARLAAAQPRDFVFDAVRGFVPRATVAPVAGQSTGADYTGGGEIQQAEGKVFFQLGAFLYVCSATPVVDSRTGYALVMSAGHCAIERGKFATNWVFIPNYDAKPAGYNKCDNTQYGCWTAKALFVHKGFASQKRFTNTAVLHDWSFALLNPGGFNGTTDLATAIGGPGYGISFSGTTAGSTLAAYGYPQAAPYDGTKLTWCKGQIGTDPNMADATWAMVCNMTGGSSGGGWLGGDWTSYGGATVRSLNSYGYKGVNNMYGPVLNSKTQATYNAANGTATTNTVVSGG